VSLRGVYPLADSLDHIGPMARSAADAARVFSVLCGFDERDPWSRAHNPPVGTTSALMPNLRGMKIGYDPAYCEEGVDPVVAAATADVMATLAELGAEIVEFTLPSIEEVLAAWVFLGSAEIATAHADTYPSKKEEYGEGLAATIETGLAVSGRDVARAWKTRIAFTRRLEGCFEAGGATAPAGASTRFSRR
jgi:amidase